MLYITDNIYISVQVDPATVKWLDRNLYIGDEIREVYEEVIKTVGTDHLLFDQVSRFLCLHEHVCTAVRGRRACRYSRNRGRLYERWIALSSG